MNENFVNHMQRSWGIRKIEEIERTLTCDPDDIVDKTECNWDRVDKERMNIVLDIVDDMRNKIKGE